MNVENRELYSKRLKGDVYLRAILKAVAELPQKSTAKDVYIMLLVLFRTQFSGKIINNILFKG